ncbi:MAG: hypothetical protein IPG83_17695 [Novosphingobium sp.]|nr:hypothetical protein [Novosphingobium sp.]
MTWGAVREGTLVDELSGGGADTAPRSAGGGDTPPNYQAISHPRLKDHARGRRIVRPCWVASERKLILPAFGALTGGMDAADPAIIAAMQPRARWTRCWVQGRLVRLPLWRGPFPPGRCEAG